MPLSTRALSRCLVGALGAFALSSLVAVAGAACRCYAAVDVALVVLPLAGFTAASLLAARMGRHVEEVVELGDDADAAVDEAWLFARAKGSPEAHPDPERGASYVRLEQALGALPLRTPPGSWQDDVRRAIEASPR
jgi:hypothetical protein